ncbi:hypothetical protein SOVF_115860 isoform A [Spinacia oleracea]|nr:hypothetical protein SOVF_115860 isoform A [Spinacia oleracea]
MAGFQFQNDELEFVDDFNEFSDFDNELLAFSESSSPMSSHSNDDPFDSDVEDYFDICEGKSKSETTAFEAKNGKDIQGIPWERLNFSRDGYRETRLKQYKNYQSLPSSRLDLGKECKQVEKGQTFYDFQFNTRLIKSTIVHFQVNFMPSFFVLDCRTKHISIM